MRKHRERMGGSGNDEEASGTGGSSGTEGWPRERCGSIRNRRKHPEQEEASGTGGSSGTEGRQRERCGGIRNRRKHRERKSGSGDGRAAAGTVRMHPEQEEASGTEGRHRERKGGSGNRGVMWVGIRCSGLGLGLGGGGEVAGGGRLVDGKVEAGYDGVEVVEDVGLELLEGLPACAGGEEVEL